MCVRRCVPSVNPGIVLDKSLSARKGLCWRGAVYISRSCPIFRGWAIATVTEQLHMGHTKWGRREGGAHTQLSRSDRRKYTKDFS